MAWQRDGWRLEKGDRWSGVMLNSSISSTLEAEAGPLQDMSQPWLHSKTPGGRGQESDSEPEIFLWVMLRICQNREGG